MVSPTVGRIVHFYPVCPGEKPQQPLAAIICHVWSDTCVNLAIFDANGCPQMQPPTSILLVQDGAERPTGGHFCEWPPRA